MKVSREELISFLKKLGLIYRANETNTQIKQRVLDDGTLVQKSFIPKKLVEYLKANGIEPPDDFKKV